MTEPLKDILFVAYDFPPQGGSGVQRSQKFVKYLPDYGYRPIVLTVDKDPSRLNGEFDASLLDEVRDVQIVRTYDWPAWAQRVGSWKIGLGTLANLVLAPDEGVLWTRGACRAVRKIAGQRRLRAIVVSVPPFSGCLLGLRLRQMLGVPLVVDFRDPWSDSFFIRWFTRFDYLRDARLERRVMQEAEAVIVATATMKTWLADRYPSSTSKVHVVYNGYDWKDFAAVDAQKDSIQSTAAAKGSLLVGFIGRFYYPRDLVGRGTAPLRDALFRLLEYTPHRFDCSTHTPDYLLRAMRALIDERPCLQDSIAFECAGRFPPDQTLVGSLGLEKQVRFHGYLPHDEALDMLRRCDVLFLPMLLGPIGRRSCILTGKVFEYLAMKKPILAAVPEGDLQDLIEETRAGWCVDPRDVQGMKSLLAELVEKKRQGTLSINPDEEVIRRFDRRKLTGDLARVLDSITSEG